MFSALSKGRHIGKALLAISTVLLLGNSSAYAAAGDQYTIDNATVDYVGALAWSSTAGGYVHLVETLPLACNPDTGQSLIFDYNTAEGRTYHLTFLTAKATGLKVQVT